MRVIFLSTEESPAVIIITDSNDERHESENDNVEIENNLVEELTNIPCDDPIDPIHKINNCQPEVLILFYNENVQENNSTCKFPFTGWILLCDIYV